MTNRPCSACGSELVVQDGGLDTEVIYCPNAQCTKNSVVDVVNHPCPECGTRLIFQPGGGKTDEVLYCGNEKCSRHKKEDVVNHPSHYTFGKYEVIDVITDWKLNFSLGNAVKYIARTGKKDPKKALEDLKKAEFYVKYEIAQREKEANVRT